MISNIKELAREIGVPECFEGDLVAAISKFVYRDTTCGCVFDETPSGVAVCGFAEGADAECMPHELAYPFEAEDFWQALEDADYEGCELYDEWNISEAEDIEAEDARQRAADMNDTLRDIGGGL